MDTTPYRFPPDALPAEICTRRLLLRQPRNSDVAALVRALGDYDVASKLGRIPHPYTPRHAHEWIAMQREARAEGQDLTFLFALRSKPDRVVGGIGAHNIHGARPVIGYWLAKPYWRRGLVSEALHGVLGAVMRINPEASPFATSLPDNCGSIRVLLKAGFKRVPGRTVLPCRARQRKMSCLMFQMPPRREAAVVPPAKLHTIDTAGITGTLLIEWGVKPGKTFGKALAEARRLASEGVGLDVIRARILASAPPPGPAIIPRRLRGHFAEAITAETPEEQANLAAVREHMAELMRCPVLEHGAIMPDACPAGAAKGTIPVGGAVISRAIHPAFHSADICCSMYASVFRAGTATGTFMDALKKATRFGPGGRKPEDQVADPITDEIEGTRNPFLMGLEGRAKAQLADQGDGNHFAYLGALSVTPQLLASLRANGQPALADALAGEATVDVLVTHHGSRDLGAQVYKRGFASASLHVARASPATPPHQAWLDPDSEQGQAYWQALQYVGRWTRRNHQLVHARTLARLGLASLAEFGNEHNFVWQRGGRYYHGKGATPAWRDEAGHPLLGLIPLNMAEPVLLTLGRDNGELASFSPHGAGRNKSRTALLRELGLLGLPPEQFRARSIEIVDRQTEGLDVRFFYDRPDVSESPMAYKNAEAVRSQIDQFGLADVIGLITPKGCIMAGDYDKPWQRPRKQTA